MKLLPIVRKTKEDVIVVLQTISNYCFVLSLMYDFNITHLSNLKDVLVFFLYPRLYGIVSLQYHVTLKERSQLLQQVKEKRTLVLYLNCNSNMHL